MFLELTAVPLGREIVGPAPPLDVQVANNGPGLTLNSRCAFRAKIDLETCFGLLLLVEI